ncbi:DUF4190 domain-containing protein [Streptomyces sp. NBC_00353]|uniref:DUF4190 domain-containing protein n=1 Tax=unclassified Streptomyces TaxID=2593676 RepID=UPI002E266151
MSQFTQPPQSPQPQQPYAPAQTPGLRPARNGLGISALILGIIGAVSGLIPFLFWLAGILGVIALILGLVGRGRVKRGEATNKGATTFGAVLGLIALILSVVGAVITFKAVGDAVDELDRAVSDTTASAAPKAGDTGSGKNKGKGSGGNEKPDAGKALEAGDSAVYDDDLTVTVGDAASYTPDSFAAGHTKGNKAYRIAVVIENAGKEKFDSALVNVEARAGKDGVNAEQIFDGKVGEGFSGTVLPGKKVTVQFAFDAPADAKNLTVEVNPGFTYDATQWDLKL